MSQIIFYQHYRADSAISLVISHCLAPNNESDFS